MADSIEMQNRGGEYENFPEEGQQETSMSDDVQRENGDDIFNDADDTDFRNRNNRPDGELPFTIYEKRQEVKRYLGDRPYYGEQSDRFLDNLSFRSSRESNSRVDIFYKGVNIGYYDTQTGEKKIFPDKKKTSGYNIDYINILNRKAHTLNGYIELSTADEASSRAISENVKKKFALEVDRLERKGDVKDSDELRQLRQDIKEIDKGAIPKTRLGKQIVDNQIRASRRPIDLQKVLRRIPVIGVLLGSVVGVVTIIVLLAKGTFYSASKTVAPAVKKKI